MTHQNHVPAASGNKTVHPSPQALSLCLISLPSTPASSLSIPHTAPFPPPPLSPQKPFPRSPSLQAKKEIKIKIETAMQMDRAHSLRSDI